MLSAQLNSRSKELNSSDEKQYLDAVLHGNQAVLRQIYKNFLPPVTKFIVQSGGRQADALDVFQDALIIIYEKSKSPDFVLTGTFFSYLYGCCRRVWGNKMQKKDNQTASTEGLFHLAASDNIQTLIENQEREKIFVAGFQKLGKDCQKLMTLFFEGHSMEEICEAMGFGSSGYAKKRKFQCKEKLTEFIEAEPGFSELKNKITVPSGDLED